MERSVGGGQGKRDARKEKNRSVTPWMRYATRYRPRCTGEKMEKREAPLETSVETSSGSKSRWRGRGESGRERGGGGWMQKNEMARHCRVVSAAVDRVVLWWYDGGDPKSTSVCKLP